MGDIGMTIELWLNPETIAANMTPFAKDNNVQREYGMYFANTSPEAPRWYVFGSAGDFTEVIGGTEVTNGNWFQLICKHDPTGNIISIKVNNGTAVTAAHTEGIRDSTSAFTIGARSDALNHYDGRIQSFRIWKRLTTDDEDTELYNSGAGRTLAYILAAGGGGTANPWYAYAQQ